VKNFDVRNFDLLALSALLTVSLLPVYHRFYDATLLIFPLAWAFTALNGHSSPSGSSDGRSAEGHLDRGSLDRRLRPIAISVIAVILIIFLFPGGTILQQLQQSGHFTAFQSHWWWNSLILPHENWCILLLTLLLLLALYRRSLLRRRRNPSIVETRPAASCLPRLTFLRTNRLSRSSSSAQSSNYHQPLWPSVSPVVKI